MVIFRTFALFDQLKMEKKPLKGAQKGDLVPYYMNGVNTPQRFNDVGITVGQPVHTQDTGPKECSKCHQQCSCPCCPAPDKGPTAKTFNVTGLLDWQVSPSTLWPSCLIDYGTGTRIRHRAS